MFGDLFHDSHSKANICVLKFSKDSAKKKDVVPTIEGRDYGPDCLYRFIPSIGTIDNPAYTLEGKQSITIEQQAFSRLQIGKFPETKANMGRRINKLKISKDSLSLEEHHEQLEIDMVRLARTDVANQRYIVLGASNEIVYALLKGYYRGCIDVPIEINENTTYNNSYLKVPLQYRLLKLVVVSNTLDVRQLYYNTNIHSGCGLRKFIQEHNDVTLTIEYIGVDENLVLQEELDFIKTLSSNITVNIKYSKDMNVDGTLDVLKQSIKHDQCQHVSVLFNLESINVYFD